MLHGEADPIFVRLKVCTKTATSRPIDIFIPKWPKIKSLNQISPSLAWGRNAQGSGKFLHKRGTRALARTVQIPTQSKNPSARYTTELALSAALMP